MDTKLILKTEIIDYINQNGETFDDMLLSAATNVSGKIKEILDKGNIDLLKNARKVIFYVVEHNHSELVAFAKQEGIAWATHSLTLALRLEWVQAIRRTVWQIINIIDEKQDIISGKLEYSKLGRLINDSVDQFLNSFFISYSDYKDEMILKQREMVEHLSVPIIPVSSMLSVLPLIGTIDSYRIKIIEEKVFYDIAKSRIQTLVIDLSGIAMMEMDVIFYFEKLLAGISMMGCKAIITGIRPDLVKKMIHTGIRFNKDAETTGTLQETLRDTFNLK